MKGYSLFGMVFILSFLAATILAIPKQAASGNSIEIISAHLSKTDVKPGDILAVTAEAKSENGIREIIADMGGIENISLKHVSGDIYNGTWQNTWKVHSTELKKYTVTLFVYDTAGNELIDRSLKFSDPSQSIPVLIISNGTASVNTSGLVGYWRFAEGSGTNAFDSSGNGNNGTITGMKAVTSNNGASINTSTSEFGGASGIFVAASSQYLNLSNSNDWAFGTNNFTIDFWVKYNSLPAGGSGGRYSFYDQNQLDSLNDFNLYLKEVGSAGSPLYQYRIYLDIGGTAYFILDSDSVSISTNTWYHITYERINGQWYHAINGVFGTTDMQGPYTINLNVPVWIGRNNNPDYLDGWIDELRVSNGIARWTSNFSPPTSAYTADSFTALLLHMDGTSGSTNFLDSSMWTTGKYGNALNFNGKITNDYEYVQINGTGTLAHTTDSSFTFSAWVFPQNNSNIEYNYIVSRQGYHAGIDYDSLYNKFVFNIWNTTHSQFNVGWNSNMYPPNHWYHVVGVADDSAKLIHIYVNGVEADTPLQYVGPLYPYNTNYYIGAAESPSGDPYNYTFNGTVNEVQIWNRSLAASEISELYQSSSAYPNGVMTGSNCPSQNSDGTDVTCKLYRNNTLAATGNSVSDTPGPGLSYYVYNTSGGANYTASSILIPINISKGTPTLVLSNSTASVNTSGLVGYWRFENESLGTAMDYSGYGNNGTLTNMNNSGNATSGPTANGRFGNGMQFDGVAGEVKVSDSPTLDLSNQGTVELWVKRMDTGRIEGLVVKQSAYYFNFIASDTLRAHLYSGGNSYDTFSNTVITDTNWHQVTLVWNTTGTQSNVLIYIDGKLDNSGNLPGAVDTNTNTVYIGSYYENSGQYFDGTMDEAQIWNRALTANEISELYQSRVTYPTSTTFTGSNCSPSGGADVYCSLYRNTTNVTATENGTAVTLPAGLSYYVYNTSGGANYTASSILIPINISKGTPTLVLSNSTASVNTSGLVGYWRFENESLGTAMDYSGYGNNGTLTNMNNSGNATSGPTANGRFGNGMQFNGVNNYIAVPNSSSWGFGTNNFSVDFWVNFNSLPTPGNYMGLWGQSDSGSPLNNQLFYVYNYAGTYFIKYDTKTSSVQNIPIAPSVSLSTKTWYHVALTRSGTTFNIYVNGASIGSNTTSVSIPNIASPFAIGADYVGGQADYLNGTIDEFRVWNGHALSASEISELYQSQVTYPTQTNFTGSNCPTSGANDVTCNFYRNTTAVGNTVLLLHMDGTNGSTTFTDSSNSQKTVTSSGGASIDTSQSVFGGSSGKFVASSNQYLSLPDSTDWGIGTGDFTLDLWVKFNSFPPSGSAAGIVEHSVDGSNIFEFGVYNNSGTYQWLAYEEASGSVYLNCFVNSGPNLAKNVWYHVAWVRKSQTWTTYQNGTSVGGTCTDSVSIPDFSAPLHVGTGVNGGDHYFDGWIDELRISKGISRWTSNFSPPTTPYTPEQNDTQTLGAGLSYYVYNTSGGQNYTSTNILLPINVSQAAPTVSVFGNFNTTYPTSSTWGCTSTNGDSGARCSLFFNMTTAVPANQTALNNTAITLNAGWFNITANSTATQNYTATNSANSSMKIYSQQSQAAPTVNVIGPKNVTYLTTVTPACTSTNGDTGARCSLFINLTTAVPANQTGLNNSATTFNAGWFNVTANSTATQNYSSVNSPNSSMKIYMQITQATPTVNAYGNFNTTYPTLSTWYCSSTNKDSGAKCSLFFNMTTAVPANQTGLNNTATELNAGWFNITANSTSTQNYTSTNSANSSMKIYSQQSQAAPTTSLAFSGGTSNTTYPTLITPFCFTSNGDSNARCSLFFNLTTSVPANQTGLNNTAVKLNVGWFNFTANNTATQNYTATNSPNSSMKINVQISQATPTVSVIGPANVTYGTPSTLACTSTNGDSGSACSLFLNLTTAVPANFTANNNTAVTLNTAWFNVTANSTATQNYSAVNSPNSSMKIYFQINKTQPVLVLSNGTVSATTDTVGAATTAIQPYSFIEGQAITSSASGVLNSIGFYVQTAAGNGRVAIYSTYSSGTFSGLLGQSADVALTTGWNDIPVTGVTIAAGTTYYIALQLSTGSAYIYQGPSGTFYYTSYAYNSFPSTTGSLSSTTTLRYMRMTYNTSSVTTSGLVGYWRFENESLGIAMDYSGYGNNGTLTNMNNSGNATSGPTANGMFGGAMQFDGVDDYIDLGNILGFVGSQNFTVGFWAKLPTYDASTHEIISKEQNSDRTGWDIVQNTDGSLAFERRATGGSWSGSVSMTYIPNSWQYFVFVFNGTTGNMYDNGTLVSTNTGMGAIGTSSANLQIGRRPLAIGYWNGTMDELQIWNRSLTASEISELYQSQVTYPTQTNFTGSNCPTSGAADVTCNLYRNLTSASNPDAQTLGAGLSYYVYNTSGGANYTSSSILIPLNIPKGTPVLSLSNNTASVNTSGLVGYWRLEEGSGTNAYDWSGNGNNGTLTNSPNVSFVSTGMFGGGVSFSNATNPNFGYIQIPGTGNLKTATNSSFTFTAWVNPNINNNTTYSTAVARIGYHTFLGTQNIGAAYNQFTFNIWNSTNTAFAIWASSKYTTGNWYFIAGVADDSAKLIHIYVNGVEAGTAVSYAGPLKDYGTANYYIGSAEPSQGSDSNNQSFNGTIDEPQIWNRALSASEISELYQSSATYTTATTFTGSNCSPSNNVMSCSLYRNTTNVTAAENATAVTLPAGLSYYVYNTTGNQNYTSTNILLPIQVSKTQPVLVLNNNTASVNTSGLVGYWRFEEGSGTNAFDSSGNGNNGTLINTPSWTTGMFGNGLQFSNANNGSSSGTYVDIANSSSLNSFNSSNRLTVAAWVYPTSGSGDLPIIAAQVNNAGSYRGFTFDLSNMVPTFYSNDSSTPASTSVPTNRWSYLTATYNNGNVVVYVNGIQQGSSSGNPTINTSSDLVIGLDNYLYGFPGSKAYFNGTIDEVQVWNRSLSASEISELYQSSVTYPTQTNFTGSNCPTSGAADVQCNLYRNTTPVGNTVLLLHMDGTNGSTTFSDSSNSHKAVTSNRGASIDTSQSEFGGASGKFVASGQQYLSIPDSPDWYFGTGNFVIDFWVKLNSLPASGSDFMIGGQQQDGSNDYFIQLSNTAGTYSWGFAQNDAGGNSFGFALATAVTTNTWYHIALVRSGSTWYIFQNGTSLGTRTYSQPISDFAGSFYIGINRNGAGSEYFDGWIDEFRVSKGTDRGWTSNFSLPTAPYTPDQTDAQTLGAGLSYYVYNTSGGQNYTSTNILLPLNVSKGIPVLSLSNNTASVNTSQLLGYWRFEDGSGTNAYDSSGNGNNGTLNSSSMWTAGGRLGSALVFNSANSSVVTFPQSSNWNFGSNDFTVSLWTYFNSLPSVGGGAYNVLWSTNDPGGSQYYLQFEITNPSGTGYTWYVEGKDASSTYFAAINNAPATVSTGQWYHFVVTRSGNNWYIFQNGVQQATNSLAVTPHTNGNLYIGADTFGNYFNGTIDEVQIFNRSLSASEISELYQSSATYPTSTTFTGSNCSPSNNVMSCSLYRNTTSVTATENATAVTLPAGLSYYIYNTTGNQNYTSTNILLPINVSQGTPTVSLLGAFNTTYGTPSTLACISTNGDSGSVCSLFLNLTTAVPANFTANNNTAVTLNAAWFNVTANSTSTQNYTAVNSPNSSMKIYFQVNKTVPTIVFSNNTASVNTSGLVGYWRFEEGSGTTASDSSGNGNNGTLINSPTWTTGMFANALNFNGTNGTYVLSNKIVSAPNAFTAIVWFKRSGNPGGGSNNQYHQIIAGINGPQYFYNRLLVSADGTSVFGQVDNSTGGLISSLSISINANGWNQIGFIYDGSNIYTIANGVISSGTSVPGGLTSGSNLVKIGEGYDSGTGDFYVTNGTIDEVQIWNRSLSSSEISELYQSSTTYPTSTTFTGSNCSPSNNVMSCSLYRNDTINATSSDNATAVTLPAGWNYYIYNTSGNQNYTSTNILLPINVSQGTPNDMSYLSNQTSNQTITYGSTAEFRGNSTSTIPPSFNLYTNLGTTKSILLNPGNPAYNYSIILDAGNWNVIYNTSGNQNWTSASNSSLYLIINQATSTVTLGTIQNATYPNTITVYCTSNTGACKMFRNTTSTVVQDTTSTENNTAINLGAAWWNYTANQSSNANYTAGSNISYVTISQATPVLILNNNTASVNTSGLVGYWRFENESLGTAMDYSGYGNNGTLTNMNNTGNSTSGPTANGIFGGGMNFDGVNDYVDAGNNASLNIANAITVSAWVKPIGNISNFQFYVSKAYQLSWAFGTTSTFTQFRWYINTTGNSSLNSPNYGNIVAGNWYHLAMTYDSSTGKWIGYVNGVPSTLGNISGTIQSSSYDVNIGRDPKITGQPANATIDEVQIWNRALTQNEIQELYQSSGPYPTSTTFTGSNCSPSGNSGVFCSLYRNTTNVTATDNATAVTLPAGFSYYVYNTTGNQNYTSSSMLLPVNITKAVPTLVLSNNTASVNTSGLVGYWRFEDGSGTTTSDYSGYGYNATLGSNISWTSGYFGNALSYNASAIGNSTNTSNNLNYTQLTVTAWVNAKDALSDRTIVARSDGNNNKYSWIFLLSSSINGNYLSFLSYPNPSSNDHFTALSSTNKMVLNTWYFVTATYDGTTVNLYQNGALVTTLTNSSGLSNTTSFVTIGGTTSLSKNPFNGTIDEVQIWNRSLSASEISELYQSSATYPSSTTFTGSNCSPSNNAMSCSLYRNDTINATSSDNATAVTLPAGWNYYVYNTSGNQNYTSTNILLPINISQGTPTVNLIGAFNTTYGTPSTLACTSTDGDSGASCNLYANLTTVVPALQNSLNNTATTLNAGWFNVTANQSATQNYTAVNAPNSSMKIYFLVNKTQPTLILNNNTASVNTSGLVGYWRFEDGSGTTASDSSGNGNIGTLTGNVTGVTPTWTTGIFGGGLSFNGSSTVQINTSFSLNLSTTNAFTYVAWIYPLNISQSSVISSVTPPTGALRSYLQIVTSTGSTSFGVALTGGNIYSSITNGIPNVNRWYQVVGVWNGTHSMTYINGVLNAGSVTSGAGKGVLTSATAIPYFIGSQNGTSNFFNGTIDEVQIFNRALSDSEISELYQSSGPYPTSTTFTGSNCSPSGGSDVFCSLYRNTTNVTATENATAVTLPAGWNYYVYNTTGGQNYTSTNILLPINISQGTPNVMAYLSNQTSNQTITYGSTAEIRGNSTTSTTPPAFNLYVQSSSTSKSILFNPGNPAYNSSIILDAGNWNVVYNTSGNQNWTSASNSSLYLIINQATSTVTLGTIANATYPNTITVYCTSNTGACSLFRNTTSTVVQDTTSTENNSAIKLGAAWWNYTANQSSNTNYTAGSNTSYVIISQATPTVSLIGAFNTTYGTASTLACYDSNDDVGGTCKLFLNLTTPVPADITSLNNTAVTLNAAWFNVTANQSATQNYTAVNSPNSSMKIYFQVNKTQPVLILNNNTASVNTSGLVGYWRFENESLGVAMDYSGYGNNGTLTNMNNTGNSSSGPTTNGMFGNALNFDGVQGRVQVADSPNLNATGEMSATAWIYPKGNTGANNQLYIAVKGSYPNYGWIFEIVNNTTTTSPVQVIIMNSGASSVNSNSLVPLNQWSFVAFTHKNNVTQIYINGKLDKNVTTRNLIPAAGILGIGSGTGYDFNGTIDEVQVWNRSLSSDEIAELYLSSATYPTSTTFTGSNCSPSNNVMLCSLYRNTTNVTATENATVVTLGAGINYYVYNTSGNQNYTSNSILLPVNISKAVPVLSLSNNTASVNTSGMVGYWRFEEGSGTIASDSSGNGNTGTLINSPIWTNGIFGNALQFNYTNNKTLNGPYVVLNYSSSNLLSSLNQMTIASWIYPTATGCDLPIISNNNPSNYKGPTLMLNNMAPYFVANNSRTTSSTTVSVNQWSYVAATYKNGNVSIYVNGVQTASSTGNNPINTTSDLFIGLDKYGYNCPDFDYYFNGTIDEVQIFNRSLTQSEIQELYQSSVTYPTSTTFTGSNCSPSGGSDVFCSLYRNTTNVTATENATAVTLGAGINYYVYNTSGGQNYTTNSILLPINISQGTPNVMAYLSNQTSNQTITYGSTAEFRGNSTSTIPPSFNLYTNLGATKSILLNPGNPAYNSSIILDAGNWNVVYNTSGNQNWTSASNSSLYLIINQATSTVTLGTIANATYPNTITVYCTSNTGACSLFRNTTSTVVQDTTSVENNTAIKLGAAWWNYTANQSSNTNYTAGSNISYVIISQATPTVNLIGAFNTTYGTASTLACYDSNDDVGGTCKLFLNLTTATPADITSLNNTATVLNAGWFNTTANVSATQNYTAVNSPNSSMKIYFQVNKTQPVLILNNNTASVNTSGLVGYWRFENESLGTAMDYSGYGNNGTLTNMNNTGNSSSGPTANGMFGGAMQFDGVDDYVSVPDSNNIDNFTAITVGAWVNFNILTQSASTSQILNKYAAGDTNRTLSLYWNNASQYFVGTIKVNGVQESVTTSHLIPSANTWYYITWTYNPSGGSSNMKIYVNGVLNGTSTWTDSIPPTPGRILSIGSATISSYFNGTIDEAQIFNRSLTASEISELYQSTAPYPTSITFTGSNCSPSGGADVSCSLYRNTTNVTATENATAVTLPAGWNYYVYNTSGGQNYTTNSILLPINISQGTPNVMLYLNNQTSNQTITYGSTTEFRGNSTSITPPSFNLYTNLGTSKSILLNPGNPAYNSSIILDAGTWQAVYNTSGNQNWTSASNSSLYLIINQATSTVTLGTIANATYPNTITVYCTSNAGACKMFRNTTSTVVQDTTSVENNTAIKLGAAWWNYTANQSSNTNYTAGSNISYVIISQATPTVNLIGAFNTTYGTASTLACYDSNDDVGGTCKLFLNLTTATPADITTLNNTATTLNAGWFNVTANQSSTQNYTAVNSPNSSMLVYFQVNKTQPVLILNNNTASVNTSQLVGYWKFDEGSGTTVYDSSGNGNNGTLNPNVTWTTGMFGGAINNTVASSGKGGVNITGTSTYNFTGYQNFTVSAWVNMNSLPPSSSTVRILAFENSSSTNSKDQYIIYGTQTGGLRFSVMNSTGTQISAGTFTANTNTWYYVVGVYNSTHVILYINGAKNDQASVSGGVGITQSSAVMGPPKVFIGRDFSGQNGATSLYFNGTIDEVQIWNRSLSSDEIAELYQSSATYPTSTTFTGSNCSPSNNVMSCSLYRNDTINATSSDNGTAVTLPAGLSYYVYNTSGNQNYTTNSILLPINVSQASLASTLHLAINSSETTPQTITYPAASNITGWNTLSGQTISFTMLQNGSSVPNPYNVQLGASGYNFTYNTSGNQNYTGSSIERDLGVNQATLILSTAINVSSPQTYPTDIKITGSGCISGATCNLYTNDSVITPQPISNPFGYKPAAGSYSYTYNSTGNQNYTSSTSTSTILISKGNVSVFLSPATQSITYGNSITPYCSINGTTVDLDSCSLWRNNVNVTVPENNTAIIYGAGAYSFAANTTATQNYSASPQNSSTLTVNKADLGLFLAFNGTQSDQSFTYENFTNATGWSNSTGQGLAFNLYRTLNVASGSPASETIRLGAGVYPYVYNSSGNSNYSSASVTRTLTITPKSINIYLALNGTQSNKSYVYPAAVNSTSWSDPTVGNEGTISLLRDGVSEGSASPVSENILLGVGTYNYSATFSATNYSASPISTNRFAIVGKGSTSVSLFLNGTQADSSSYYTNRGANFTVVSNVSGKTVNLDTNITGWATAIGTTSLINYTKLNTVGKFNVTGYFAGDQNYSSSSATYYATVNQLLLTPTCSAGGPYASNPIVTIAGSTTFNDYSTDTGPVLVEIRNNGAVVSSSNVTSSPQGTFITQLSNLGTGTYTANISATSETNYAGNCQYQFSVSPSSSCTTGYKNITLGGYAYNTNTGNLISSGNVTATIKETGDTASGTFTGGQWSLSFNACVISNSRYTLGIKVTDPTGLSSYSQSQFVSP